MSADRRRSKSRRSPTTSLPNSLSSETTRHPADANARAVASPMPLPAPVTNTFFTPMLLMVTVALFAKSQSDSTHHPTRPRLFFPARGAVRVEGVIGNQPVLTPPAAGSYRKSDFSGLTDVLEKRSLSNLPFL